MPWGDVFVLGGMLSRFVSELYPPLPFLEKVIQRGELGFTNEG
jgi:hypothetical protein